MSAEIRSLYSCVCGAPAQPYERAVAGEVVAHGPLCPACRAATDDLLERVKPTYLAIIKAGLGHAIASATITFMLDEMDRAGQLTGELRI